MRGARSTLGWREKPPHHRQPRLLPADPPVPSAASLAPTPIGERQFDTLTPGSATVRSRVRHRVDFTDEQLGAVHEALRFLLKDDRLQDELVPLRQAYKRIRKAAEASLCVDCGARWATRKSRCSRCYMREATKGAFRFMGGVASISPTSTFAARSG